MKYLYALLITLQCATHLHAAAASTEWGTDPQSVVTTPTGVALKRVDLSSLGIDADSTFTDINGSYCISQGEASACIDSIAEPPQQLRKAGLAKVLVKVMGPIIKAALGQALANLGSPTECRSAFNKEMVINLGNREGVIGSFGVAASECKNGEFYASDYAMAKASVFCGGASFRYYYTVIGEGEKSWIKYDGKRGWNMWGYSGWQTCSSDTSIVTGYNCDGEDPAYKGRLCYDGHNSFSA